MDPVHRRSPRWAIPVCWDQSELGGSLRRQAQRGQSVPLLPYYPLAPPGHSRLAPSLSLPSGVPRFIYILTSLSPRYPTSRSFSFFFFVILSSHPLPYNNSFLLTISKLWRATRLRTNIHKDIGPPSRGLFQAFSFTVHEREALSFLPPSAVFLPMVSVTLTIHMWSSPRVVRSYTGPFHLDFNGYTNLAESVPFMDWFRASWRTKIQTYNRTTRAFQMQEINSYFLRPNQPSLSPILLAQKDFLHHIGLAAVTPPPNAAHPPLPPIPRFHYMVSSCLEFRFFW